MKFTSTHAIILIVIVAVVGSMIYKKQKG